MVEFMLEGEKFQSGAVEPGLYIVATPIGNLNDITIRALKILAGCSLIACEDTRTTGKLLKHFGISTKMLPYHEHNAERAGKKILNALSDSKSVALVSDAGTPLISDPGYRLVSEARKKNFRIIPIPGACAPMAALVASGLPTDNFQFAGFLPSKTAARQKRMQELVDFSGSLIVFESPNRIHACIDDMKKIFGAERNISICRELTKLHEEISTASLAQLAEKIDGRKLRGEIVIVIEASRQEQVIDVGKLLEELLENMSLSSAAAEAASLTGINKRELYQRALQISDRKKP
ncbi:MAG: 16S rRNA (cytidine(1402)-2'-O)-methyltransferase [Rhizobiaceae bacterium]|nr:16S rRNA (cytidine(1402)-2'-O)-methyltransferase [Rhizobiaceae bacterium]